jgi:hypothetical protein
MQTKNDYILKHLIPLEIQDNIKVLESRQIPRWSYWNKYWVCEICSNIAFKVKFKEEILWVSLYNGIGYRSDEVQSRVIVTSQYQMMDEDLYDTTTDLENAVAKELSEILRDFYFEDNDLGESIYHEDTEFIQNYAYELEKLQYIIFDEKIDRLNPSEQTIIELELKLKKARELLK